MAPLVVPLAADEVPLLTLVEWDALVGRDKVMFEDIDHPLADRLKRAGVAVEALEGEPDATRTTWAVVVAPDSSMIDLLASRGAVVTAGMATPPDGLAAARGAYVGRRAQAALGSLVLTMARLRGKDGCPWDAKQTHESLQQHLLEEAHEVLEKIDQGDTGAGLEEELGDLLLQVMFHSELAAEEGRFDIAGVADVIVAKLVRRHPHVFGDVVVEDAAEVITNWEKIKKTEGKPSEDAADPFAGIPATLPALVIASKTLKKAQGLDLQVSEAEAISRVRTALDSSDIGDAILWLVALARARHVDAEGALRRSVQALKASLTG